MSPHDSLKAPLARCEQTKAWTYRHAGLAGRMARPLTDAEVIAAWSPVSQDHRGQWRFNPLLDLPLKACAGMDKHRLWEMFVYRLAQSEVQNLLELERSWTSCSERRSRESAPMQVLADEQVAWNESREAPLRPSDLAASIIVWLWHNGLRREAIGVLERIWQTMRDRQEGSAQKCIPWPAQSMLDGFRAAAHRDWDDNDHAELAVMFRELHVDKKIDQAIDALSG
jgi:hypothetical protein